MRIISTPLVKNDQGQPATIGVIGSCRIHRPIQQMVVAGEANLIAAPFNCYTHTPQEARQYLAYCLGEKLVPPALFPFIFGRAEFRHTNRHVADLVRSVDLLIVEVSGRARLRASGHELQNNYFSTNFVRAGGREYLNWWRSVTTGDSTLGQVSDELIARTGDKALPVWAREIIATAEMSRMEWPEMSEGLAALAASHSARILFVTHFNLPEPDGIEERDHTTRLVKRFGSETGVAVYDPSELIAKVGREYALKADGRDIYHYAEEFEADLGRDIVKAAADVMETPHHDREAEIEDRIWLHPDMAYAASSERLAELITEDAPEGLRAFAARKLLDSDEKNESVLTFLAQHSLDSGKLQSATVFASAAMALDPSNRSAASVILRIEAERGGDQLDQSFDHAISLGDDASIAYVIDRIRRISGPGMPLRDKAEALVAQRKQKAAELLNSEDPIQLYKALESLSLLDPASKPSCREKMVDLLRGLVGDLKVADAAGQLEDVVQIAGHLIELNSYLEMAYPALSRAEFGRGNLRAAIVASRKCIELDPDNPAYHLTLGRMLNNQGTVVAAARAFLSALRIGDAGKSSKVRSAAAEMLRGLSTSLVQTGRRIEGAAKTVPSLLEAYECYQLAASTPNNADKLDVWSANLRRQAMLRVLDLGKRNAQCFELEAEAFLGAWPDDERVSWLLAQSHSQNRHFDKAFPLWEKLAEKEPANWVPHLQIARCYAWLSLEVEKQAAATRALEIKPDLQEAHDLLRTDAAEDLPLER